MEQALGKMYKTDEWQVVRDRNGLRIDNYKADQDFAFLEDQEEKQMGDLVRELGFLK